VKALDFDIENYRRLGAAIVLSALDEYKMALHYLYRITKTPCTEEPEMVIHKVPYVIARMEKQRDGIGKNSEQRTEADIKKIIKLKTDVSYKISKIESEVKEYKSCIDFFHSDECSILCSISAETMISTINGQIHRGEWQRVYRTNVRENGKSTDE
jgi:hypothetical protein